MSWHLSHRSQVIGLEVTPLMLFSVDKWKNLISTFGKIFFKIGKLTDGSDVLNVTENLAQYIQSSIGLLKL